MFRKIFIITLVLSFIAIAAWQVLAQYDAKPLTEIVTISNGPVADKPNVSRTICINGSDIVTFLNNTGVQINVNNTATPPSKPDKDGGGGNNVANNNSVDYQFNCPDDAGSWTFTVTQGANTTNVIVNVTCTSTNCNRTPTLTQWGMLILVLLILATGVYLWMRRKPLAT